MQLAPLERAHQLREYGLATSNLLRDASRHVKPENRSEILALSARIRFCSDHANNWFGTDIHNGQTGELFEGFGRYWHCSSKLCSYCLRLNSRRNRLTLSRAIQAQRPKPHLTDAELAKKYPKLVGKSGLSTGEHYRFITLTLPNLDLDIPLKRAIINRAWALLRKRSFFVRSVVGGAKAEEFTVTTQGYHYHIHLLVRSKNIRANELRRAWTESVQTAFADFAVPFQCPTSDGLLIVNIKIVHDLQKVQNEVCKYMTKANSWAKLPTDQLIEIALIPMWHRMFEIFGSFRNLDRKKLAEDLKDEHDQTPKKDPGEDNDELSNPRNHWRILIKQISLKKYLARLHAEVNDTIKRRSVIIQLKFPFATITTLDTG